MTGIDWSFYENLVASKLVTVSLKDTSLPECLCSFFLRYLAPRNKTQAACGFAGPSSQVGATQAWPGAWHSTAKTPLFQLLAAVLLASPAGRQAAATPPHLHWPACTTLICQPRGCTQYASEPQWLLAGLLYLKCAEVCSSCNPPTYIGLHVLH